MNDQKIISFLILMLLSTSAIIGQILKNEYISKTELNNNPSLESPEVHLDNNTLSGNITFQYVQNLAPYQYEADEAVKLVVSLLNVRPKSGLASIHGAKTEYFDWAYDELTNSYQGIQRKDFYKGFNAEIQIDIIVDNALPCIGKNKMGFNANIQPAPKMNGVNNTEDDSVSKYGCLDAVTNTEDLEEDWIGIHPNPFYNEFKIERLNQNEKLTINIFNATGKLITGLKLDVSEREKRFDLKNEKAGMYVIFISNKNTTRVKKLIKIN